MIEAIMKLFENGLVQAVGIFLIICGAILLIKWIIKNN